MRRIALLLSASIFVLAILAWKHTAPTRAEDKASFPSQESAQVQPEGLQGALSSAPVAPLDTAGLPAAGPVGGPPQAEAEVQPLRLPPRVADAQREADPQIPPLPGEPQVPFEAQEVTVPPPLLNFPGLGSTTIIPPDTNGAPGFNHYVQIVNDSGAGARVGVWDKNNGSFLFEFGLNQLWPAGDDCREYPRGDPIVLYDQLANRWLLSQFTEPPSGPYNECIAISKTSTPTNQPNGYYLYTFEVHPTKFNDYPKLGIWPDAYYMTANQFILAPFEQWAGTGVWAFDRQAMLSGQPATFQYFDLADLDLNYGSLLPATLTGQTLPPGGAPGYFASVDQDWNGTQDVLHLFEFQVDWNNPSLSTFGLAQDLVVPAFDWYIAGFTFNTVSQPDTFQRLDDLSDRLMMHLAYRNFGSHEALVVNHTIDVYNAPASTYGLAGIRWYEVRGGAVNTTLADATLHQSGTLGSPADTLNRWMGSVAMDRFGNMALGYSVSNTTVYPGIRYTGRLSADPLGQMPQGEGTIQDGSGSQLNFRGRWGDYTSMSLDPVDDCTFWYTNQYIETTANVNWKTQIASFRYPGCTSSPTFFVETTPPTLEICTPNPGVYAVEVVGVAGFQDPVTLAAGGAPPGASLAFGTNPVVPPANTTLTVGNTASVPSGSYPLVITGTAGTTERTSLVNLDVFRDPPAQIVLTGPPDGALEVALRPTFTWGAESSASTYRLEVATDPAFSSLVYSAANLPGTSQVIPFDLQLSTRYYWHVQAQNACGTSSYSLTSSFTTLSLQQSSLYLPLVVLHTTIIPRYVLYFPALREQTISDQP
jgi:hypothetical protein